MKTDLKIGTIVLIILAASSYAWGAVPGDQNGDNIVNLDELLAAQNGAKEGMISTDQLNEIMHISEEYPRTIVDSDNKTVTIYKPIYKIIVLDSYSAEALITLGAKNRIVGIVDVVKKRVKLFPDLSHLPVVGTYMEPDAESIIELNPDLVLIAGKWQYDCLGDKLEHANIPIASIAFHEPGIIVENMKKLGYILNETENVSKYLAWHDEYVNEIKSKVSEIPEDKKVRVLIDYGGTALSRKTPTKAKGLNEYCTEAGGINVASELEGDTAEVEIEWILEQNPDVIVGYDRSSRGGYETDNVTKVKIFHDEIVALPGFENVEAIKDDRVYIIFSGITGGPGYIVASAYLAKLFHPDRFKELEPQAIHQEYLAKFLGLDYDPKEHGVFVYPPLEEN